METEEPTTDQTDESQTSQMPAVAPTASQLEPVIWPEDPYEADGRAAEEQPAQAPLVTTPVIPTWPEGVAGEPSVPSHEPVRPGGDEPVTAPFLAMKTQPPAPAPAVETEEEEHDTVPPAPADEVDTADAKLESLPPEVEAVEEADAETPAPVIDEAAIAEEVEAVETPAEAEPEVAAAEAVEEPEPVAAAEPEPEPEPEPQPEPDAPPAEPVQEPGPEPEPVKAEEPEPAPAPEPEPVAEAVQPVEPATPAPATPAWAAQTAPAPAQPQSAAPAATYQPPVNPSIPSWAPGAPRQETAPVPDAPTQWPGVNVPAWAPQATASHPGTANPLPSAGGVYADPVRGSASAPAPAAPAPAPAPQPAPAAAAPTAPAIPAATTGSQPPKAKTTSSSWEVVEQKRQEQEHKPQGPTAEDKSYAEWFAWAKRSGAPASACHAAAQGAFRALAAGQDMNTAVQWATLAMASPPGLVGQSRQLYCAWYSLGNIDLKLPTPQAHAFAQGAISALEQGADSMGAHQAGLMAAGITGG
ncbi:MAG TPA: hypothetical protein VI384_03770 [Candidatus Dormibacteraeota bacterium]